MSDPRSRAIIFDVDGTLLRSAEVDEQLYMEAIDSVLGKVRFRDSLDDYRNVTDSGILIEVFSDNGIDTDESIVDAIKFAFFSAVEQHVADHGPFEEIPGAKDFVRRIIASSDCQCAIATGGWRRSALYKLHSAGFALDEVPLAASDDTPERTAIMRHALQAINGEDASVTYYGDGVWDKRACEELGWGFRAVGPKLSGLSRFDQEVFA